MKIRIPPPALNQKECMSIAFLLQGPILNEGEGVIEIPSRNKERDEEKLAILRNAGIAFELISP